MASLAASKSATYPASFEVDVTALSICMDRDEDDSGANAAAPAPTFGLWTPAPCTIIVLGPGRVFLTRSRPVGTEESTHSESHGGQGGDRREGSMVSTVWLRLPLIDEGEERMWLSGCRCRDPS